MRDLFSKLLTGSMVAGAALLVAACGGSTTANTSDTNMAMDNSMDMGTMNDVTAVDGATGSDSNMAMGNSGGMMSNDSGSMMSNDSMSSNMSNM